MEHKQKVIDYLNMLLADEFLAQNQYLIHSEMYLDWGYKKLYEHSKGEVTDETEHSRQLIQRILILGGVINVKEFQFTIGTDVPSMLRSDLALELKVRDNLKKGIVLCEQERDFATREIILGQLRDTEEDHAYWLEQQLRLIDSLGLENYLQYVAM